MTPTHKTNRDALARFVQGLKQSSLPQHRKTKVQELFLDDESFVHDASCVAQLGTLRYVLGLSPEPPSPPGCDELKLTRLLDPPLTWTEIDERIVDVLHQLVPSWVKDLFTVVGSPIRPQVLEAPSNDVFGVVVAALQTRGVSDETLLEIALQTLPTVTKAGEVTSFGRYVLEHASIKLTQLKPGMATNKLAGLYLCARPETFHEHRDWFVTSARAATDDRGRSQGEWYLGQLIDLLLDHDARASGELVRSLAKELTTPEPLLRAASHLLAVFPDDKELPWELAHRAATATARHSAEHGNLKEEDVEWLLVHYGVRALEIFEVHQFANNAIRLAHLTAISKHLRERAVPHLVRELCKRWNNKRYGAIDHKSYVAGVLNRLEAHDLTPYLAKIQGSFRTVEAPHVRKQIDRLLTPKDRKKPAASHTKLPDTQRFLFDEAGPRVIEECAEVVLKERAAITAPIFRSRLFYDPETTSLRLVKLELASGDEIEIELLIPYDDNGVLTAFKASWGYEGNDSLCFADTGRIPEAVWIYELIACSSGWVKHLKDAGIRFARGHRLVFHHSLGDATATVDEYKAVVEAGVPRAFVDAESLKQFAYLCYRSPAKQRWMIGAGRR